jgi:hypothetical protein
MWDQGVWAEIKVGGEHLRLFSERNSQGVQASVYNVIAKSWVAPSGPVDDIETGKRQSDRICEDVSAPSRTPRNAPVGMEEISFGIVRISSFYFSNLVQL